MEKSSHYYGIYALCIACNLKDHVARKIAFASQYVDDAKINTMTFDRDYGDSEFSIENGKSRITNIATCHSYFKIKTLNYQAMIYNTAAFHFFPGNDGDTFTRKLRCMPKPKILCDLIQEVVQDDTLVPEKLGMLLHIFADTYAHQGFSGLISKENDVEKVKSSQEKSLALRIGKITRFIAGKLIFLFDRHVPAYGHAQVYNYPDIPFGLWEYEYDQSDDFSGAGKLSKNDNTQRYSDAFSTIAQEILSNIADRGVFTEDKQYEPSEVQKVIAVLNRPASAAKKTKIWKKILRNYIGDRFSPYAEDEWLKEIFTDYSKKKYAARVVKDAKLVSHYRDSSWYHFIKAMKWYKKEFISRNGIEGLTISV